MVDGGADTIDRDAMYFHYPHYYHAPVSTPASAIRVGEWKLIQFYEDQHVELFNLAEDPSEKNELSGKNPDKTVELRQKLNVWLSDVGANLPSVNPDYTK